MEKYEIKVDKVRRVVYEKPMGLWNEDDYNRWVKDYKSKVIPALGNSQPWAVCADLTAYKTSSITEKLNEFVKWKVENGVAKTAMIVSSATVKMQMNRAVKDTPTAPQAFTSLNEADTWLKSVGF